MHNNRYLTRPKFVGSIAALGGSMTFRFEDGTTIELNMLEGAALAQKLHEDGYRVGTPIDRHTTVTVSKINDK